jgi:hypothetical protein
MGKMKKVLMAAVILAVMVVMALRGCPRRTHGRRVRFQSRAPLVSEHHPVSILAGEVKTGAEILWRMEMR